MTYIHRRPANERSTTDLPRPAIWEATMQPDGYLGLLGSSVSPDPETRVWKQEAQPRRSEDDVQEGRPMAKKRNHMSKGRV